ncbi:MAG: hypothetical protein ACLSGI_07420 [Butyricicoccaceae bacterium]
MTLLEQLQAAAENARKGLPAALTIDADGVQYTRNFMPQERLILLGGGTIAQRFAAMRPISVLNWSWRTTDRPCQPSALSGSKADCMRSVSGGNRENRHPRERLRCRYHARASL